jgi:hypothetical protein
MTLPDPTVSIVPDGQGSAPVRKRDSLFLLARLQIDGAGPVYDVRVRNLSEGGLMAELNQVVKTDTPVLLELRGVGGVAGRVVWCEQGRMGIAFDQSIDPRAARKPVGGGGTTPHYAKAVAFNTAPPRR